jgi:4-hydroxyproline epimerase
MNTPSAPIRVIDSHTEGEPTRTIIAGGPDLGRGPIAERVVRFRETADRFRTTAVLEPRGSEAVVGALLCEPHDPSCAAGVIFFNNVGYLGMCGHGAIGVAVTLHYMGRIGLGKHRIETPVGVVEVDLLSPNEVAVENVSSYRYRAGVSVEVEGLGKITGDVAWGGNWFYLIERPEVDLSADNIGALTLAAQAVRDALAKNNITGENGGEIDHIEFFGQPKLPGGDSRNFVLCPGGAYDRSPCGTGTSAKLACLAAAGKLAPGETWVQESIIGGRFSASYRLGQNGQIIPRIVGRAFITAEATLIQQTGDPFIHGISARGMS